jgi:hypothetical protein
MDTLAFAICATKNPLLGDTVGVWLVWRMSAFGCDFVVGKYYTLKRST